MPHPAGSKGSLGAPFSEAEQGFIKAGIQKGISSKFGGPAKGIAAAIGGGTAGALVVAKRAGAFNRQHGGSGLPNPEVLGPLGAPLSGSEREIIRIGVRRGIGKHPLAGAIGGGVAAVGVIARRVATFNKQRQASPSDGFAPVSGSKFKRQRGRIPSIVASSIQGRRRIRQPGLGNSVMKRLG